MTTRIRSSRLLLARLNRNEGLRKEKDDALPTFGPCSYINRMHYGFPGQERTV